MLGHSTVIHDISAPLAPGLPLWPGSPGFTIETLRDHDAGPVHASRLALELHTGAHLDAPLHFIPAGAPIDRFPLDRFIGPAHVVHLGAPDTITAKDLDRPGVPNGTRRLLLRTRNSELWQTGTFDPDYVALDSSAAHWLVEHGIELIGIDYLSIQKYRDGPEVHQILLGAGVLILEGIDLARVEAGHYILCCMPLALTGVEASPVRAVLLAVASGSSPES